MNSKMIYIINNNKEKRTNQSILKSEYADIPSMVYMVATHYRVGKVLDPYAGECVARYLVVLVGALRVVRHVEADVLAVADVAVLDHGVGARAAYAHRCAHCTAYIFYLFMFLANT